MPNTATGKVVMYALVWREDRKGMVQIGQEPNRLMDIQMPNMNGYEATKIIRGFSDKKKANIPIVAMTANAFEEDRRNALEVGIDNYIAKPIDIEKMIEVLKKELASNQSI